MGVDRGRETDSRLLSRIRPLFVTGLVIILPLVITVWLLRLLFTLVHGISTPLILRILAWVNPPLAEDPAFSTYGAPLIGLILTLVLVVLVGALATNLLGRRLVEAFDRIMMRLPLIKGIYGGARQLLDAMNRKTSSFQRVVAVEYPRKGIYTVGFVTRDQTTLRVAGGVSPQGYTLVFLPTSPNPTSGWLVAVRDGDLLPLDLSIEEGVKLIVSGGLVVPSRWTA